MENRKRPWEALQMYRHRWGVGFNGDTGRCFTVAQAMTISAIGIADGQQKEAEN